MTDKVQMNYNVMPETREKVERLAEITHRNPGQMLDLVIEEAWARFMAERQLKIEPAVENQNRGQS